MTDDELLRLIAQQDATAFREWYDRYSGPLYGYLCRLLGDAYAAEDALSETMMAVWTGACRFRGDCSPRTWVYRIARNRAAEWKRRQRGEDGEAHQQAQVRPHEEATDRLALQQALASLPPDQREVVELAFLHGLGYREVAQVVGCPVNTVKTRVYWAKRKLRRFLEGSGGARGASQG